MNILLCPFCGKKAEVEPFGKWTDDRTFVTCDDLWYVGCEECPCSLDTTFDSKDKAIEAWNKRC